MSPSFFDKRYQSFMDWSVLWPGIKAGSHGDAISHETHQASEASVRSQQQQRERELRKQHEREQRRRYEEMEQLRREEERRHAEREQVGAHARANASVRPSNAAQPATPYIRDLEQIIQIHVLILCF